MYLVHLVHGKIGNWSVWSENKVGSVGEPRKAGINCAIFFFFSFSLFPCFPFSLHTTLLFHRFGTAASSGLLHILLFFESRQTSTLVQGPPALIGSSIGGAWSSPDRGLLPSRIRLPTFSHCLNTMTAKCKE